MSQAQITKRSLLYPALIVVCILAAAGITAWTVTSSPAQNPAAQATATYALPFAVAKYAKPTYTPTSTQIPTFTPEPVVQAEIVTDASLAQDTFAQSPSAYTGGKSILVDISDQHMYVYESETLIYSFVASTGMNNATRTGTFSVLDKIPNAFGATWNIWMPSWLGIYWAGTLENGIHALPILPNGATLWAGYLGTPISYGCIVLGSSEAQMLFEWAEVGVPVQIQW